VELVEQVQRERAVVTLDRVVRGGWEPRDVVDATGEVGEEVLAARPAGPGEGGFVVELVRRVVEERHRAPPLPRIAASMRGEVS
jgi:hypothetical protein